MILGPFYYQTETFMITDPDRPGVTYERALAVAEKHGDTKAGTLQGTVHRIHNDAGEIIGYNVRSRHYIGAPGSNLPDKPKDRPR